MPTAEASRSDVQIFVSHDDDDPRILRFRASAEDPRLGLGTFVDYGRTLLRVEPEVYLDQLFGQLQLAGAETAARLEDAGVRLFEELLPFELRRRLWRAGPAIRSLFVVSAEAWIPWELLKLQDPEGEEIGPFFAELELGRWLGGAQGSAITHLPLSRIGLVVPGNSFLPAARSESAAIRSLASERREVVAIPAALEPLAEALAEAAFDGLHFCGHGEGAEGESEPYFLDLESGIFEPGHLFGKARRLGRRHPLIFLNACHVGRAGKSLAAVGGLPASFLRVGAGAVIAALWQVSDDGAALFAKAFYREFVAGASLGAAVRRARGELRQNFPDDPTWLAYILVGHPGAFCREAEGFEPSAAPRVAPPAASPAPEGASPAVAVALAGSLLARGSSARRPASGGAAATGSGLRWPVLALVVLIAAGCGLASWRTPTQVRLEGRATAFSARLAGEAASLLDEAPTFRRCSLTQAGAVELVTDLSAEPEKIALGPADVLTVSAATAESLGGTLPRLHLAARERIAFGAEKLRSGVAVRIEGKAAQAPYEILLPVPFRLQSASPAEPRELESPSPSRLRVFPGSDDLILEADLAGETGAGRRRLLEKAVELDSLEFTEHRPADATLRSSLTYLKVLYPGAGNSPPVELGRDGVLVVDPQDRFRLTLLELDPAGGELVFALEGRARQLRGGTPGQLADLRLTLWARTGGAAAWLAVAAVALTGGFWARRFRQKPFWIPAGAGGESI